MTNIADTTINGRRYYKVASRSNPGTFHMSNKDVCSCLGFQFHQHCYHQGLCMCVRCLGEGSCLGDGPEGCYFCGGTGDAR